MAHLCFIFSEDTEPTVASHSSSESSEEDDYTAYIKGDDVFLSKYDNEHQKFKAAEKAMQKHQHEKVTLVSCFDASGGGTIREVTNDAEGGKLPPFEFASLCIIGNLPYLSGRRVHVYCLPYIIGYLPYLSGRREYVFIAWLCTIHLQPNLP